MMKTNGKRTTQLATNQQQLPAIQQPVAPTPVLILAQLAPLVGPINDAEILEQLEQICPRGVAGDLSIETEIVYYEED